MTSVDTRAPGPTREVWPGRAYPLGATYDGVGTNFAVFSEVASGAAPGPAAFPPDDSLVDTALEHDARQAAVRVPAMAQAALRRRDGRLTPSAGRS